MLDIQIKDILFLNPNISPGFGKVKQVGPTFPKYIMFNIDFKYWPKLVSNILILYIAIFEKN